MWSLDNNGEGQWPSGRVVALEPGGPGFDSSSRQPQVVAHQHWARWITATPSLVLCCAWLVTMTLHVHCGLGQLSPLPTSGDDKWAAAKHCGRAKRSRISDTHRLRSSLQFRYINNQYFLFLLHFLIIQSFQDFEIWTKIRTKTRTKMILGIRTKTRTKMICRIEIKLKLKWLLSKK